MFLVSFPPIHLFHPISSSRSRVPTAQSPNSRSYLIASEESLGALSRAKETLEIVFGVSSERTVINIVYFKSDRMGGVAISVNLITGGRGLSAPALLFFK